MAIFCASFGDEPRKTNGKETQIRSEQCALGESHCAGEHAGDHGVGAAGFPLALWSAAQLVGARQSLCGALHFLWHGHHLRVSPAVGASILQSPLAYQDGGTAGWRHGDAGFGDQLGLGSSAPSQARRSRGGSLQHHKRFLARAHRLDHVQAQDRSAYGQRERSGQRSHGDVATPLVAPLGRAHWLWDSDTRWRSCTAARLSSANIRNVTAAINSR